jgi:molybdopterin molybdotransferase
VDGYAVRLGDPASRFRVVDEIRAGEWELRRLQPGEAGRIATGGALPGEDLLVVMREDAQREGEFAVLLRRDAERNIRFRGEDARTGKLLVPAGTVLRPGTLALLASVGCARPSVTRLPRVLHVATGNEIVPPGRSPARGQIRDSNSTLVRAFLAGWGIVLEQRRVAEDAESVASGLRPPSSGIAAPDLLLISGGASVGEHDFTRRVLETLGFTVYVSKTATRPGKPLIVAHRGTTLAFGLPGNPLAHFVCLHLHVRAALRFLTGAAPLRLFYAGQLAVDLQAGGNARETFWPGCWNLREGTARLTPLRWGSSGDLTSLATANALIRVPAGAATIAAGARVEFMPTEEIP